MKTSLIFTAALVSACAFAAETVNFTAADFAQGSKAKTKDGVITVPGQQFLSSKKTFKIDPAKTYKLSADLRTAEGAPTANYIGFQVCDEQGRGFNANWVHAAPKTEGELAAPVKATDTSIKIKVKNPAVWKNMPNHYTVAFDTKDDLSDLPNRKISGYFKGGANKIEGDVVTVELRGKANFDRPAGTKVRAHSSSGYLYAKYGQAPNTWTAFKGQVKGFSKTGGNAQWWVGGKTARIVILPGWNRRGSAVELKNITLTIE